jgi:hypothetical protein
MWASCAMAMRSGNQRFTKYKWLQITGETVLMYLRFPCSFMQGFPIYLGSVNKIESHGQYFPSAAVFFHQHSGDPSASSPTWADILHFHFHFNLRSILELFHIHIHIHKDKAPHHTTPTTLRNIH